MTRILATALAVLALVVFATASGRLTEKKIDWGSKLKSVPIVDGPERVAGYFKLNSTKDAHMFYFFFEARENADNAPLVMWLQGGPGCSSEFALFYENGPYKINDDLSLDETEFGWDTNHNMLFIDQPIGTGFSYSEDSNDYPTDEDTVADDLLDFILEFYESRPHLRAAPLYITGESFAGHYIPAAAYRFWKASNLELIDPINLVGIAMGNPLVDAKIQFDSYGDFAAKNNLIPEAMASSMHWWYNGCKWSIDFCEWLNWDSVCSIANDICQYVSFVPVMTLNPGINVYDITKQCDVPGCYDTSLAEQLLNDPKVQEMLGVGKREWVGCNTDTYMDLAGDIARPYDMKLVPLLEDGVKVLVYAGERDLICNYMGNEAWLDVLPWEGAGEWADAVAEDWTAPGAKEPSGTVRTAGKKLTFVKVNKAGHMSPMDQPSAVHYMISIFTGGAISEKRVDPASKLRLGRPAKVAARELREEMETRVSA